MGYVFGIDLGTTYSCIAYIDEYGKASVLKNSDGDHTTPSVVMIESERNTVVGIEAKRSIETDSDKTVQFIKRKMGKENDTTVLNGITYHAPEISSMILKKLVDDANSELRQLGVISEHEEVKDVVITCPAYFGMNERQATKTAGELIGLNVLDIINEPTAAAISYGVSGKGKNETVLVYDLGGGTFDITVMNIAGGDIRVICTGGDDHLGGKDWDEALIKYVTDRYQEEFDEDLTEDPEISESLYVDVETWKKTLTSRESVKISVNGPSGRLREELTREKYEELTKDLLNKTKNLLDDILSKSEDAGYPLSKIDKVLLVGGSSRMPQVAKMIEQDYHMTPMLADPDEAVAKGAAVYASNQKAFKDFVVGEAAKSGKSVDEMLGDNDSVEELNQKFALSTGNSSGIEKLSSKNVLSRSYGVKCISNGREAISTLLEINQELPAKGKDNFGTNLDNQSGVSLQIFEYISSEKLLFDIDEREPIVVADMRFKQAVPKGTGVLVELHLDNSGLLHIIAEEQLNHSKLDTTFQLSNQMSDEELKKATLRMSAITIE